MIPAVETEEESSKLMAMLKNELQINIQTSHKSII